MALNAMLLVIAATLSVMTAVRFVNDNLLQGTVNLVFSILSILGLFWIRGNKNRITTVACIASLSAWVVISTLFFSVPEDTLRIGWFLVLLAPTFFLCGSKFGILISVLSLLVVCSVHIFGDSGYSNYDILYYSILSAVITIFLSFYEYKVTKNRVQLQALNRKLEDKVQERTAELTKANKELIVFFHALDTSLDSVIVTDMNGVINYTNKAALNFSGYADHEIIDQNADIFFSDENYVTEQVLPYQKNMAGGKMNSRHRERMEPGFLPLPVLQLSLTNQIPLLEYYLFSGILQRSNGLRKKKYSSKENSIKPAKWKQLA